MVKLFHMSIIITFTCKQLTNLGHMNRKISESYREKRSRFLKKECFSLQKF